MFWGLYHVGFWETTQTICSPVSPLFLVIWALCVWDSQKPHKQNLLPCFSSVSRCMSSLCMGFSETTETIRSPVSPLFLVIWALCMEKTFLCGRCTGIVPFFIPLFLMCYMANNNTYTYICIHVWFQVKHLIMKGSPSKGGNFPNRVCFVAPSFSFDSAICRITFVS